MNLEDKYILSRWAYSVGEPLPDMSDADYNNLHRYMRDQKLLPDYTERAWSSDPCPYELLKKYNMENLAHNVILSDKTESMDAFLRGRS